ncbi:hypothetical protein Scep_015122 [Stephania cephalantha]|uniref:Uncharacterized protein n=1 Tax=Stephania cephalantha TaxID=152367 RepID=A0AAP0J2G3_9MAGN
MAMLLQRLSSWFSKSFTSMYTSPSSGRNHGRVDLGFQCHWFMFNLGSRVVIEFKRGKRKVIKRNIGEIIERLYIYKKVGAEYRKTQYYNKSITQEQTLKNRLNKEGSKLECPPLKTELLIYRRIADEKAILQTTLRKRESQMALHKSKRQTKNLSVRKRLERGVLGGTMTMLLQRLSSWFSKSFTSMYTSPSSGRNHGRVDLGFQCHWFMFNLGSRVVIEFKRYRDICENTPRVGCQTVIETFIGRELPADCEIKHVYLGLCGNSLTGTLSPDMCQLTGLWYFDVRGNNLNGSIPDSIGNCTSFEILDVSYNQITGEIPYNIGFLQVATLSLQGNRLTRKIPKVIGLMQALAVLDLSENELVGPIPLIFGNLTYTGKLYLHGNKLTDQYRRSLAI